MKLTPRDTYFGVLHAFADVELRVTGEENGAIAFLPGRVVVQRALMATKIWSAWTLYGPHSGQGAGNGYSGQGTNVVITS